MLTKSAFILWMVYNDLQINDLYIFTWSNYGKTSNIQKYYYNFKELFLFEYIIKYNLFLMKSNIFLFCISNNTYIHTHIHTYTMNIKSLHTPVKMPGFCDVKKWDQDK